MHDIIFKNSMIIDGTGAPAYHGDVAIDNNRISEVGNLGRSDGGHIIDAEGKAVTPGFIDMHSHADFSLPVWPTDRMAGSRAGAHVTNAKATGIGTRTQSATRNGETPWEFAGTATSRASTLITKAFTPIGDVIGPTAIMIAAMYARCRFRCPWSCAI